MKKFIAAIAAVLGIFLVVCEVNIKMKEAAAISIIGGADGPTSIFIAGKIGDGFISGIILGGIAFICISIVIYKNLKNK